MGFVQFYKGGPLADRYKWSQLWSLHKRELYMATCWFQMFLCSPLFGEASKFASIFFRWLGSSTKHFKKSQWFQHQMTRRIRNIFVHGTSWWRSFSLYVCIPRAQKWPLCYFFFLKVLSNQNIRLSFGFLSVVETGDGFSMIFFWKKNNKKPIPFGLLKNSQVENRYDLDQVGGEIPPATKTPPGVSRWRWDVLRFSWM